MKQEWRLATPTDISALPGQVPVYGIMITNKGFQRGCQQVASHFRIELGKVKNAHDFVVKYQDRIGAAYSDQMVQADAFLYSLDIAKVP